MKDIKQANTTQIERHEKIGPSISVWNYVASVFTVVGLIFSWLMWDAAKSQDENSRKQTLIEAEQVELSKKQETIQSALKDISKQQLKLTEISTDLQRNLVIPIVSYERAPAVEFSEIKKQLRGPDRGDMIHSYPEKSYFIVSAGIGVPHNLTAIYTGWIFYSDTCPFVPHSGRNKSIDVAFDHWLVGENSIHSKSSANRKNNDPNATGFLDVIAPGLERRIHQIESALSQKLPGCVGDTRIYGDFSVDIADVRSEEHRVFFSGYLKGNVDVTLKRTYQLADERKRTIAVCTVGKKPEQIEDCVRVIKEQSLTFP